MKIRVLVLGAGGYIGQRLNAALAATDWAEPIAAVRRAGASAARDVRVVDATDRAALAQAIRDVDAVVNCVAGSEQTMVAGARALRSAFDALADRAPRLVHFSSMAVYGPVTGVVDESAALSAELGPYASGKVQAERLLAERDGVVVLRPGCIYGPGSPQWSERIARLLRAGRIGDLGAAGDACSNLVHVDDVIEATLRALRRPPTGHVAYNLAMRDAPRWNDYFIAYGRALGAVPVPRIGRRWLMLEKKLLGPALKIAELLARRVGLDTGILPPPISPSLLRLWGQDIRLCSARAEQDLGMSWRPLRPALSNLVGPA